MPVLNLSPTEEFFVGAIALLREKAYGVTIFDKAIELAERQIPFGTLYTTLTRLEQKGFISGYWSQPQPVQGGRRRRYYRVTGAGEVALRDVQGRSRRLAEGLDLALGVL